MNKKLSFLSWNVNGLRANIKKGGFDWVLNQNLDFFCFQEVKANVDQLPAEVVNIPGYFSYFDHSKIKKGYSGVAVYSKKKADLVEYGLGIEDLDQEGRQIALFFKGEEFVKPFVFINTYFPNGGGGDERLGFKMRYYKAFLEYINDKRQKGYAVIFTGDVNTAHKEIDIARPKENENNTGFLPIERAWIDDVISSGYVDTFRNLNPEKKNFYSWWDMKTFARDRNIGWRLDYFFVSDDVFASVKKSEILSNILGSDHCPVYLEINLLK